MSALSLPGNPEEFLAGHARALDDAYREVGGRMADSAVSVDDDGRLHVGRLQAIP